jgi:hypothetical protein
MAATESNSKSKRPQTTVRLDPARKKAFEEAVERLNKKENTKKSMNDVMEDLVQRYLDNDPALTENSGARRAKLDIVVKILKESVCAQLSRHSEWARDAIVNADLGLPGETEFDERSGHFSSEKLFLGLKMAEFLMRRITHLLADGSSSVYLLLDSGTTIFWVFKALAEALKDQKDILVSKRLHLVTNNLPGIQTFVSHCGHQEIDHGDTKAPVSDFVDCRVLAGMALPLYAAVTGEETNEDLRKICSSARKATPRVTFLGLTTGNWVRLDQPQTQTKGYVPFLLARGQGHPEFKRTLLAVSDEIYVVAPIGKLIRQATDKLNKALGYRKSSSSAKGKAYQDVAIPHEKIANTKLVSTIRMDPHSILLQHSALIQALLKHRQLDYDPFATRDVREIPHLLFTFDTPSVETKPTQIEIEFPHVHTRREDFMYEFFSVASVV